MKKYFFIFLVATCLLALASCECRKADCAAGDARLLLFLSKTDSTDLFLSGQYALGSLAISPIVVDSTKPGDIVSIKGYVNSLSYLVYISSDKNTAGYLIQLDSLPPDTLMATLGLSEGGDCCPGVLEFETFLLNGDTIVNDRTLQTIRIYK